MRYYRVTISPRPLARTAGEVRFVKDKSDSNQWAFDDGKYQTLRDIDDDFSFNPKQVKPLACALRSLLMALGHAMSGYQRFTKIKSRLISPDGMLGGKGYILKIKDIRSMLMNSVEVLSAVTDTLYDEINAPHWEPATQDKDVSEVLEDVEDIREDPEDYAREEEAEADQGSKKATARRVLYAFERLSSDVQVHSPYGVVWEGPYKDLYASVPHPNLQKLMVSTEVKVPADLIDYAVALHHNDLIYRVAGKGGLDV